MISITSKLFLKDLPNDYINKIYLSSIYSSRITRYINKNIYGLALKKYHVQRFRLPNKKSYYK